MLKEPTVWEEWRKSKRLEQRQKGETDWGVEYSEYWLSRQNNFKTVKLF